MSIVSKISVIINTLNEESILDKCFIELQWVDESILIDMHSIDESIRIGKKFTNKIFYFKKNIFVEPARNYGINKAIGDWILVMDADEMLSEGAEKIIRKLIKDKRYDGYWFPRRNYINDKTYLKHGFFYPDYQLRLFRNRKDIRYSGVIHAQVQIPKEKTKIINDVVINHLPVRTKFDSIFHFNRFFNYIKVEGDMAAKSKISNFKLLQELAMETLRNFYRCFVRKSGYKDGINGFRAAIIWAMYQGAIRAYALKIRVLKSPVKSP